MAQIKINALKTTHIALIVAIVVSSGCATTDHKLTQRDKVLSIGSVQSTSNSKEQPISLIAGSNIDGHLMCFYEDQTKSTVRVYPSEYGSNTYIKQGSVVDLSGPATAKFTRTDNGSEKVACFLTQQSVSDQLPDTFKQNKFISYNITKIKGIFREVAEDNYHYAEARL